MRRAALLLAALALAGCTLPKPPKPVVWKVSEADRRAIRAVALAPVQAGPEVTLALPAKGTDEGAGRGGRIGAAAPVAVGASSGSGALFAVGVLLAPFTGVVGAVVGAGMALPAEQVEADEQIVRSGFAAANIPARLAESVRARILTETGRISVAADAGAGADAIVEISVTKAGLDGPQTIDPPVTLVLETRARMIRRPGDRLLWDRPVLYEGPEATLAEWAADDSAKLRKEIDFAIAHTAERIVEELFLVHMPASLAGAPK